MFSVQGSGEKSRFSVNSPTHTSKEMTYAFEYLQTFGQSTVDSQSQTFRESIVKLSQESKSVDSQIHASSLVKFSAETINPTPYTFAVNSQAHTWT